MSSTSNANQSKALPARHLELLDKAFGEGKWRPDNTLKGYSGAGVYQIAYQNTVSIVKIARSEAIEREYTNHSNHVAKIHKIAPWTIKPPLFSDDGQEALIHYTYAAVDISKSFTLFEYLTNPKANRKRIQAVSKVLQEIFRDHGHSWWGDAKRHRIPARIYYERFLPVDLQVAHFAAPPLKANKVQASQIDRDSLDILEQGQEICLEGFQIEKSEDQVLTLTAKAAHETTPIRIQLQPAQGTRGEVLPTAYGYVKHTRKTFLYAKAKAEFDGIDPNTPYFTADGRYYRNPLYYLNEMFDTPNFTNVSIIHGDFNLRNVLVEEPKQPNNTPTNYWVIDFASTGEGPVLLDLQWLETQVINWLLVPALRRSHKGPHELAIALECLHKGVSLPLRLRRSLGIPYGILREIRQLAKHYLYEKNENEGQWQEYYRGLTIMLVGTLKHETLRNDICEDINKFALIAAATTVQWAGVKEANPPSNWTTWLRKAGIALVGILALAVTVYGAIVNRGAIERLAQGLWGSSTPTATVTPPTPPLNTTLTPTPTEALVASRLDLIKKRGHLICGINGTFSGFSKISDNEKLEKDRLYEHDKVIGVDADFCRAVAIAVFNDATRVKFKVLTSSNRFAAVEKGDVDVAFRNTTWTPGRDALVDFGPPYWFTQQQFLALENSEIKTFDDLAGKKICVYPKTTHWANLAILKAKGIDFEIVTLDADDEFTTFQDAAEAFFTTPKCDILTSDTEQLVSSYSGLKVQEGYKLLPFVLSDEPRTPILPENDSNWRDVVSYAVWSTIYAQELGVSQKNLAQYDQTTELLYKVFLGIDEPDRITQHIGEALGLHPQFAYNIIKTLGNYEEIYQRNLSWLDLGLNRDLATKLGVDPDQAVKQNVNQPWKFYRDGRWELNPQGRLFTPPFAPEPWEESTLTPLASAPAISARCDNSQPLVIIAAINQSGLRQALGKDQLTVAKAATDYFNNLGGVRGRCILIDTSDKWDLKSKIETADLEPIFQGIRESQAVASIGPGLSTQVLELVEFLQEIGLPVIGPSTTEPTLLIKIKENFLRVSLPIDRYASKSISIAQDGAFSRAVVAYAIDDDFTKSEAEVFTTTLLNDYLDQDLAKLKPITFTTAMKAGDFTTQVEEICNFNPDLVIISGLTQDGGSLIHQLRSQKCFTGVIIGGNGLNTPRLFAFCKEYCENILIAQAYNYDNPSEINQQFRKKFKDPTQFPAQMFTAIQVVVESLKKIDSIETIDLANRDALTDIRQKLYGQILAIGALNPLETPLGKLWFRDDHEMEQEEACVAKIVKIGEPESEGNIIKYDKAYQFEIVEGSCNSID